MTLPSLSVRPEKPCDPPIYFFNPLQRLGGMTLIFLFKSFPPPGLNLSSFEQIWTIETNLDSRDKDARGEDDGGLWFPQPLTLNLFARAFYSILLFSLEYGWKVFYIPKQPQHIKRASLSKLYSRTELLSFLVPRKEWQLHRVMGPWN